MKEYSLKFTQLARYAPYVVAGSKSRMSKCVSWVNDSMVKECRTAILISEIDLARLMIHAQQIEEQKYKESEKQNKKARIGSFNFSQPKLESGNRSGFHPKSSVPAPSSASAPVPKFRDGNRDRAPGPKP